MSSEDQPDAAGSTSARPALRVVRGAPTAEELAGLLAVLAARPGSEAPPPVERPQSWSAHWRGVRQPLHAGPDGWRSSARPR